MSGWYSYLPKGRMTSARPEPGEPLPQSTPFPGLTTAHFVTLLAVLIFSVNYVVGRGVYQDAPPFMLGFTRWAGAAVLLAPFAMRQVRAEWPLLVENWRTIAACALLMPFIGAGLAYTALTMTVAINVAVVQTALPVFMVLLARIVLKDRLTAAQRIGLCGAILGVLDIISRGDPAILATLSFNAGDLLMVFCNLGLAGFAIGHRAQALRLGRPHGGPRGCPGQYPARETRASTLSRHRPDRRYTALPVLRHRVKGFVVQPRRWIVERTIAWLNRCRRLAKDWENLNRNALAFLKLASIRLMLRKLCNPL